MAYYRNFISEIGRALENIKVTSGGVDLVDEEGMARWCEMTRCLRDAGRTMYFIGNGASASMASHMSADACKNGMLRCSCFNEISLLTAISNDVSYEQAFAVPLRRFGNAGDMLVAISSSGNSPNVIAGIAAARDMGMKVVTLSGMSLENRSRQAGDLNFYVPASSYGVVESCHQVILHSWLDQYIDETQAARGKWG
jgi:D-sedoheptulose 7-phosphate isomerase